jgi:hypothetical protein
MNLFTLSPNLRKPLNHFLGKFQLISKQFRRGSAYFKAWSAGHMCKICCHKQAKGLTITSVNFSYQIFLTKQ